MRSQRTSLLAPFLCLALIAGCSGSDDPGASGTDQSPAGSSTSGPPTNGGSATGTSATTSAGRSTGSTPSSECRREADVAPPGRTVLTLQSDGQERNYMRYVPEGLTAGAPAPLVVDFPAYSPASLEESFSGFTKPDADGLVKADEVGAVVVTPEPVNGAGGLLTWNYVGPTGGPTTSSSSPTCSTTSGQAPASTPTGCWSPGSPSAPCSPPSPPANRPTSSRCSPPGSVGMDAYEDLLGPVSDALDATDLIWAFFEAHT